jgi:hypothetical protein
VIEPIGISDTGVVMYNITFKFVDMIPGNSMLENLKAARLSTSSEYGILTETNDYYEYTTVTGVYKVDHENHYYSQMDLPLGENGIIIDGVKRIYSDIERLVLGINSVHNFPTMKVFIDGFEKMFNIMQNGGYDAVDVITRNCIGIPGFD